MDELEHSQIVARGVGVGHQNLLNKLSDVDPLLVDDFLTSGIDPNAGIGLFAFLATRDHRLPTTIVSQSGPAYWVEALSGRVAADSTVNRLVN